jgi:Holliday junction resolvase
VSNKRKGTRGEHRAKRILEAAGYVVTKAGGSLGLFDLIAIGPSDVRCVQVKSGSARLSGIEREAIKALIVPTNVSREYWRFPDYARAPLIERL